MPDRSSPISVAPLELLHELSEHDPHASLCSPDSAAHVRHPEHWRVATTTGAYTKELRLDRILRDRAHPLYAVGTIAERKRAWVWDPRPSETEIGDGHAPHGSATAELAAHHQATDAQRSLLQGEAERSSLDRASRRQAATHPASAGSTTDHAPRTGPPTDHAPHEATPPQVDPAGYGLASEAAGAAALECFRELADSLRTAGFIPDVLPLSLGDLADALMDDELPGILASREVYGAARAASSLPFHEWEALSSGGPLAHRDAAAAVARMRDDLRTCSTVLAERWGRRITIDMADEVALLPEPSPTGAMAFSPHAHELGDWLELSVRELAEGRGQLVVLARAFAEDSQLREDADGALVPARPVTSDPWSLYVVDAGALTRFRLHTPAVPPRG